MPRIAQYPDGLVIEGTWPCALQDWKFPLCVADPPYGRIVNEHWDKFNDEQACYLTQIEAIRAVQRVLLPAAALYWFGGYGKPHFRPFYRVAADLERECPPLEIAAHITWGKKRAYGVDWNYLSTREEILYCVNGPMKEPRRFNIPLLEQKRGYAGYNKKYPAKSEFLRRTMVWSDITEVLRDKVHPCQKPEDLIEVIISVHLEPGETVLDLYSGSGATALAARKVGCRFVSLEDDATHFNTILSRLGPYVAMHTYTP